MKHTKLLLGALAIGSIAVACNNPPATDAGMPGDAGRDTGPTIDTGVGDSGRDTGPSTDAGNDAFAVDSGVTLDCAGYCTFITTTCTAANAQYTDMADCMTRCTAAGWTAGVATDTSGNTLGCRIYHATAAQADAAMHCPHAGYIGGGVCTPFRTTAPVEGTPTATLGAYVRVDRMGQPAVATALIGPGLASGVGAAKDAYNDSNPTEDAAIASGVQLLTAIGFYHQALDAQLIAAGLTPCSVTHTFPVPGVPVPVPACGVQHYDGTDLTAAGRPVVSLILPDTLRLDTAAASHFPNGRTPTDAVIDPILSVLLLNMSLCAGTPTGAACSAHTTMAMCTPDTNCTWTGTACAPAATSSVGVCGALATMATCGGNAHCTWTGTACRPVPCEAIPAAATAAACPTFPGCSASLCGGARCTAGTLGAGTGLNPTANDVTLDLTTFPFFAPPH